MIRSLRLTNIVSGSFNKLFLETCNVTVNPIRNAARKGTRDKRAKKKVKVEPVKVGFIPHNQRKKEQLLASRPQLKFDDSKKDLPVDDVYLVKYYQMPTYPFLEALECHKELHHPEIYNVPDAPLNVTVELNMQAEKTTRFVENFTRMVDVPFPFDHGEERAVLAFTKDVDLQKKCMEAGAQLAGGVELIKQIQAGALSTKDFRHIVAHPDIFHELVNLKGMLKKNFPNPKMGTLDVDLPGAVLRFLNGLNYRAVKDEYEKDFGLVETTIGPLSMEPLHLEANFAMLLKSINQMRPKRSGDFISRVLLKSPPSAETFRIDYKCYIEENSKQEEKEVPERVVL